MYILVCNVIMYYHQLELCGVVTGLMLVSLCRVINVTLVEAYQRRTEISPRGVEHSYFNVSWSALVEGLSLD